MTILSEAPEIDAKVIDAVAIINKFKPTFGKTFLDFQHICVIYFQSP